MGQILATASRNAKNARSLIELNLNDEFIPEAVSEPVYASSALQRNGIVVASNQPYEKVIDELAARLGTAVSFFSSRWTIDTYSPWLEKPAGQPSLPLVIHSSPL